MSARHSGKLAWAIAWLFLAAYEAWALVFGGETLSRASWEMGEAWGPFPFVVGLVVGMLVAHFWWRWDPRDPTKGKG
jgi:hypothetical protein